MLIALATLFSISGQLLLKAAMSRLAQQRTTPAATSTGGRSLLIDIALSPRVIGGLVVYGSGVIFWLMAISRLPISFLYPFASLSYVGIIIGSAVIFKEHINRTRMIGIFVIMAGVVIIGLTGTTPA
jgi:multidrug transporter EmrE-like cation transporter